MRLITEYKFKTTQKCKTTQVSYVLQADVPAYDQESVVVVVAAAGGVNDAD